MLIKESTEKIRSVFVYFIKKQKEEFDSEKGERMNTDKQNKG